MRWLFLIMLIPIHLGISQCIPSLTPSILEIIHFAAKKENVPPKLLRAICYVESQNQPNALHKNDGGSSSYGLCQIKYKTAKSLGFNRSPSYLQNPFYNAVFAARFLKYQYKRYHNWKKAVHAYNAGHYEEGSDDGYEKKVLLVMSRY